MERYIQIPCTHFQSSESNVFNSFFPMFCQCEGEMGCLPWHQFLPWTPPHLTRADSISSANQAPKSSALTPSKVSKYGGLAPPTPQVAQISGNPPYLSSVRCPQLHLFTCPSRPVELRYPSVFFSVSLRNCPVSLWNGRNFLNLPGDFSKISPPHPLSIKRTLECEYNPFLLIISMVINSINAVGDRRDSYLWFHMVPYISIWIQDFTWFHLVLKMVPLGSIWFHLFMMRTKRVCVIEEVAIYGYTHHWWHQLLLHRVATCPVGLRCW